LFQRVIESNISIVLWKNNEIRVFKKNLFVVFAAKYDVIAFFRVIDSVVNDSNRSKLFD